MARRSRKFSAAHMRRRIQGPHPWTAAIAALQNSGGGGSCKQTATEPEDYEEPRDRRDPHCRIEG